MLDKKERLEKARFLFSSGLIYEIKRFKIVQGLSDYGIKLENANAVDLKTLKEIYILLLNSTFKEENDEKSEVWGKI